MHRAIAAWLTARPWRAGVASAVCGALAPQMLPFMAVLAGAIPVLVALRFDARRAVAVAASGAFAAALVLLIGARSAPTAWIAAWMAAMLFGPSLLAILLRRTGSLNLCFQIAVLFAA